MEKEATILIVDDENGIRQSLNILLKDKYNIRLASTGKEAFSIFKKSRINVILLDILLPDTDGLELLSRFKKIDPPVEVIMITAVNDIQSAVKATKLGAYEYVVKPFVIDEMLNIILRAVEKGRLLMGVTHLRNGLDRCQPFEKIIGEDIKMRHIFNLITTIAESDGPVLIEGESGTGKELVARAVHNLGLRKDEPYVVVNCAAIPKTLMESELFGHNKGAFTGASQTKIGKLELADNGTVFLDDIDTLDVNMQAKLLRVIQEKEFERLGSSKINKIEVRFLAASNRNLKELIAKGEFREDLFYRLNVFPINIPPLRERKNDIPLLLEFFLKQNERKTGKPAKKFSKKALDYVMKYDWPGNVRELQNFVERFYTTTKGTLIHIKDISAMTVDRGHLKGMTLKEAVSTFETEYIQGVLQRTNGNRKKATEILGIHRNTLLSKINEFNIDPN